jgi:hypothetical protein
MDAVKMGRSTLWTIVSKNYLDSLGFECYRNTITTVKLQ